MIGAFRVGRSAAPLCRLAVPYRAAQPRPGLADASLGHGDPEEATSRSRLLQSRQIRRRVFLLHRVTICRHH
jgi:hypothetical protein